MTTKNKVPPKDVSENTQETLQKWPTDWASWLIWLSLALIIGVSAYAISRRQAATTAVWAPVRDLPAYYLITAADVTTKTVANSLAPEKPVSASVPLDLHYTLQSLPAGQAIQESQLVPVANSALVSDTVPVSLPATPAMAFNGRLASGGHVTVWTVTDSGKAEVLLDEVLVLDVQKAAGLDETKGNVFPYTIVVAVPETKVAALLTAVVNQTLTLTLNP